MFTLGVLPWLMREAAEGAHNDLRRRGVRCGTIAMRIAASVPFVIVFLGWRASDTFVPALIVGAGLWLASFFAAGGLQLRWFAYSLLVPVTAVGGLLLDLVAGLGLYAHFGGYGVVPIVGAAIFGLGAVVAPVREGMVTQ
jgi:hypothetical protein